MFNFLDRVSRSNAEGLDLHVLLLDSVQAVDLLLIGRLLLEVAQGLVFDDACNDNLVVNIWLQL